MRYTMTRTIAAVLGLALILSTSDTGALGLKAVGIRVGVDLTQQSSFALQQDAYAQANSFDSASLVLGGHLDLGAMIFPRLHLVPGMDLVLQKNLRIYSINTEAKYHFLEGGKTEGYAGGGVGIHLYRPEAAPLVAQTKVSVNIPLGFQRKMGHGLMWFGELKMVIANDQVDSSFRFSTGFALGGN